MQLDRFHWTRRWGVPALFAALVVGGAGVAASTAQAVMPAGGPPPAWGGPLVLGGRALDNLLDSVEATAEQRQQIKAIADAAHQDLQARRASARSLHEQGVALFTQPKIDAAAAESLRQQALAQHDQASRRRLQAMLDIGNVLTPEQRRQLAERLAQRAAEHPQHGRRHGGQPLDNPTR